jgi:hypothetical protein
MTRYEKLIRGAEDMEDAARRVAQNGEHKHEIMAKVWLAKAKELRALAREMTIGEVDNV